jgi:hypothetical protein
MPRPHQRIDGAAATQNVPKGHIEFSVVQLGNRRDRQLPVQRTADVVEPNAWIADREPYQRRPIRQPELWRQSLTTRRQRSRRTRLHPRQCNRKRLRAFFGWPPHYRRRRTPDLPSRPKARRYSADDGHEATLAQLPARHLVQEDLYHFIGIGHLGSSILAAALVPGAMRFKSGIGAGRCES